MAAKSSPDTADLAGFERSEVEAALGDLGARPFHGRQLFHWIHGRDTTDFSAMTDLGRGLRERLAGQFIVSTPSVESRQISTDGTTKFLLRLGDGRQIEAVYIPDTPAQTFCISTQVGCAMGCTFCLTGLMGLTRHLTAAEIAGQVRVLARETGLAGSAFNIVLMGMGEPLHNYDATMKALRILTDDLGLAVPPRRITLSTVGVLPALARLADEPVMPNLAVSLHATTDEQRARITFEYVLLEGVNDTPEDARRLAKLLGNIKSKVNLLPLNEAPGLPFRRPSDARVDAFAAILAERGVTVSVRKSRGRDIRAACGQLIVEGQQKSAGQQAASLLGGT